MKIDLRILAQSDATAALKEDARLAEAVALDDTVFTLDAESPLFDRFLERTRGTSGCWLNPVTTFTPAEMRDARLFQVECRKMLPERPGDYEANVARLEARPFREIAGFRTRTLDQVTLGRASLRPNQVAGIGDWTAEYVVARGVVRVFQEAGLVGYDLGTVYGGTGGAAYEDLFLLRTERRMPPAELDLTTRPLPPGDPEGGYRLLSCLTYGPDALELDGDFFRTAENWSSNHMPTWLVSARVREVFHAHKLRGWAFRPVLELGSEPRQRYHATWTSLMARIREANPRHHF